MKREKNPKTLSKSRNRKYISHLEQVVEKIESTGHEHEMERSCTNLNRSATRSAYKSCKDKREHIVFKQLTRTDRFTKLDS